MEARKWFRAFASLVAAPVLAALALACGLIPTLASASLLQPETLPRDASTFNLILRNSDDPDLLSAREASLRQKYIDMGVGPGHTWERPTISTLLQRQFATAADWYRELGPRQVEILEIDFLTRKVMVYRFPETSLFFTDVDTNLIGVAFEGPRDMAAPELSIQLDDLEGWNRHWVSIGIQDKWRQQLRNAAAQDADSKALLNFTIPIKLPRTLERIIGRGDATNIRISGTETISIGGSSTRRSDFVANEIQQSQSLFPTLEMKQTLRVNLDGTVGEKIKVKVSHDSERLGSESTEVKLAFEGDEDDIIQTIRAGNIDVTLPGSRLLGVSASTGGLFGIKVEGALGPLEFTLLTSKEESQQNQQNFSQSGGSEDEVVIRSTEYAKGRFFRLLAPESLYFPQQPGELDPLGRIHDNSLVSTNGLIIDFNSIEVYVSIGAGISDENTVDHAYAYVDTNGDGWEDADGSDFDSSVLLGVPREERDRWRRLERGIDWNTLVDGNGNATGLLMSRSYSANEVLACTYLLVDEDTGEPVRKVGRPIDDIDGPLIDDPERPNEETFYFKLIKPANEPDPFSEYDSEGNPIGDLTEFALTWEYEFRNFYDLRGREISPEGFEVRVLRDTPGATFPERVDNDSTKPLWIKVFGLDQLDASGNPGSDEVVDVTNGQLINLNLGYLQFPIGTPFSPPDAAVEFYTGGELTEFPDDLDAPRVYQKVLTPNEEANSSFFNIVVKQTAVSSRLRLNAFNIKEGSEEVTLNGKILQRNTEYTIDYFSGEVNLLGEAAASLNAQSNIGVRFEVDPLFGGGRTSLNGMNLTYRLGTQNTLSTTWLLQTKPNNSTKPRLGEEPSKNWVGNFSAKLRFNPGWVRSVANWIPKVDSDQPVSTSLDAEVAVSVPNPNTKGDAYLEDFESVDESVNVPVGRNGWWWASMPAEYRGGADRVFGPEDRAYAGWHRAVPGLQRGFINPTLSEQERRDVLPSLELRVISKDPGTPWDSSEYAGIMRSFGGNLDFTQSQFLEFWLDDGTGNVPLDQLDTGRPGRLHFDFGIINEDFFWPRATEDSLVIGKQDDEDQDNDGRLSIDEDTGLDGRPNSAERPFDAVIPNRPGTGSDLAGDDYDAEEGEGKVFLRINGTEGNRELDSEDIDRSGSFDLGDGYFTLTLELSDLDQAIVDIYRDYADFPDFIADREADGHAWRKYRLDLREIEARTHQGGANAPYQLATPDLSRVRSIRIWYEDDEGGPAERRIRLAEMRFLGNRWISEGVRDSLNTLVPLAARGAQDFRLGVVNNKDNPDYVPPVFPDTRNNVAEKEQSLQLLYTDLEPGNSVRARKDLPGRQGQDYTKYGELNFFWREPYENGFPSTTTTPLETFFWVGSDSVNYYEINTRFGPPEAGATPIQTNGDGWQECRLSIADLTDVKVNGDIVPFDPGDPEGEIVRTGLVADALTGEFYRIVVRGFPDLRRVQRYYAGVRYPAENVSSPPNSVSGEVLFNEIRLKSVNDKKGFAQRYAVSAQIPGVADLQFDWSQTDAEFRGLNQDQGSGVTRRAWNARASSNLSNFLPTFGLDLPFSLNQREDIDEPKYKTLSDVELLDADARSAEKTYSISRSFSLQARKSEPSKWKIFQYTIDRFSMSWNGTRSDRLTPNADTRQVSQDRKFNYDLRLRQGFPIKLPWMKEELKLLPNQVTLATSWRFDDQSAWDKPIPGNTAQRVQRASKEIKTNVNNATLTFQFLRTLRGSYAMGSNRNLLLDKPDNPTQLLGLLHTGREEVYNQRWNLAWKSELKLLKWLKPDVEFSSAYQENRRPGIRQSALSGDDSINGDGFIGDPGQVRNLSANSDLSVRGQLNLTGWLKKKFGQKARAPQRNPEALRRNERREDQRMDRGRNRTSPEATVPGIEPPSADSSDSTDALGDTGDPDDPFADLQDDEADDGFGDGTDTFENPPADDEEPTLSPEEAERRRLQEEAERQLREREEEAERLREEQLAGEGPEDEAGEDELEDEREVDPMAAVRGLVRPFKNLVVQMNPINSSYQFQKQSDFQQVNGRAPWLYRLGLSHAPSAISEIGLVPLELDENKVPIRFVDNPYTSNNIQTTQRYSFSTQSQLSDAIRVDTSYSYRSLVREGTRGGSEDRSVEFPVVGFRVSKVHEWRMFGDLFSSSNIDINYKETSSETKTSGFSASFPKTSRSLQPRWTFRFQNGLDANLNVTWSKDQSENTVSRLVSRNLRANVKLQKNFDADGALSFLRFGKRGTGSTIDMNVDIGFTKASSDRESKTATGGNDQPGGQTRYSISPDFTYQFSRNLRAGLRIDLSRNKQRATEATTTTVGLFLNATLSF